MISTNSDYCVKTIVSDCQNAYYFIFPALSNPKILKQRSFDARYACNCRHKQQKIQVS